MSYRVQVTSVKPANVVWFTGTSQEAKDAMGRFRNWAKSVNGLVSFSKNRPDANTIVRVYEFDSKASYDAFTASKNSNPDHVARTNYNNNNGIVTTYTVL